MISFRGANEDLAEVLEGNLPKAQVIHLSNVSNGVLTKVKGKAAVSLDPGAGVKNLRLEDLEGVKFLLLNETECRILTGMELEEGAELFLDWVETVVVKLGAKGAYMAGGGARKLIPAFRVKSLDTTGAGDAFDAGFLSAIICGKVLEDAVSWGNGAAALKVQHKSARCGLPTREDLMAFLSSQNP
jgi:ribokinase